MELNREQKEFFRDNGFVRIPGVVPPVMVEAALRAINHGVGEGMDREQMPIYRARSYVPELQGEPVIRDLFAATPAVRLAESLLGEGNLRPVGGGQIALRFPRPGDPPTRFGGHIDGMHSPNNGVPEGVISSFTMLCGVLLSPLTAPWCGNFTVWPGTHRLAQDYFREHGPEALLEGMPQVQYPEPYQVIGQPGDIYFAHYLTTHGAAPNLSPHVRYAIFFRLRHVDHEGWRKETFTDMWTEFPGMASVLETAEAVA